MKRRASRLPDLCQPSHRRRVERAGLQPVHRDSLLRERLSVQRALLRVRQPGVGQAAAPPAQSRRVGAQRRRDGKVHVLRPAHQGGADSRPRPTAARSATARSSRRVPSRARRRRSCLAISTIRRARSHASRDLDGARNCSKSSERSRRSPTSPGRRHDRRLCSSRCCARRGGSWSSSWSSARSWRQARVRGSIRSITASAWRASAGRCSGRSTSPTSSSGSASATRARWSRRSCASSTLAGGGR